MAENAPAAGGDPAAAGGAPANPTAPATTGTDPAKPASSTQGFDPTTLSDEDYAKFFSDPRAFTHPRFKALNEAATKAKALEEANEKAENARLADEKKYQELAQKHETRANELQGQLETTRVDNRIATEASKLGITDLEAATKLIDRSGISVDANGAVVGVEEAVKALAESKTYLVDKSKQVPTIGSPSNPSNTNTSDGSVKTFKASEIRDPAFYRENEKAINAAMKVPGAIINDLQPAKT